MSIFDDHASVESIQKLTDAYILKEYNISNSGSSLIPRNTALGSYDKRLWSRLPRVPTVGVYKEAKSIFKGMYGGKAVTEARLYNTFIKCIDSMGLEALTYNGKAYYQINRDGKRQLSRMIENEMKKENV